MGKWFSLLILLVSIIAPSVSVGAEGTEDIELSTDRLLIDKVKTDGAGQGEEFVSIFNPSYLDVSTDGWLVEYTEMLSETEVVDCKTSDWVDVSKIRFTIGDVTIPPKGSISIYIGTMYDNKPGAIRLIQSKNKSEVVVHDLVGWGTDSSKPYCYETFPASIPKDKELISRCIDDEGIFMDTDDNLEDFIVVSNDYNTTPVCPDYSANDEIDNQAGNCSSLTITEILPNVSGVDTGREYIEIYNPTEGVLSLYGCKLSLGEESKFFSFGEGATLQPDEYRAYYDNQTNLTLPNAAGGSIVMFDSQNELVFSYPAGLEEDVAWALIDGEWQRTNRPTPSASNLSAEIIVSEVLSDNKTLEPCSEGKYRNPETNRCKSYETASALVPCKEGQVRNPETNRCRKKATESSMLKPCPEGQERNPETNRCRKVQATLATATAKDSNDGHKQNHISYVLLALAGIAAVGYGIYEYRHDFRYKMSVLKSRITPNKGGK